MNNPLKTTQKYATTLDFQNKSMCINYLLYWNIYFINPLCYPEGKVVRTSAAVIADKFDGRFPDAVGKAHGAQHQDNAPVPA